MFGKNYMFRAACVWHGVILLFACCQTTLASPLHLTVQAKGTNQVELTMWPVNQAGICGVLVRSNGPDSHWTIFGTYYGPSNKTISATCDLPEGMTLQTLKNWKFVAGDWAYSPYYDIPPLARELIFRTDPSSYVDPNASLIGDGWANIQKFQNNMDPFRWYPPPAPQLNASFHGGMNNNHMGTAVLTWQVLQGAVPDYFLIERANRTMKQPKDFKYDRPPPGARFGGFGTNRSPRMGPLYGTPGWRSEDPMITGPFEFVAQVPGRAGVRDYRYIETNVDTFIQPLYRMQPHYSPPLHAYLQKIDAAEIRKTILPVSARQTTNGYALTVSHPIPHAWYLLLVRDKNNLQWRASGYFASGATRNPVNLHVDKKGMMTEGQSPIALPAVKFLPDVVDPEFTAGWGDDSDGDGLPDIYEVLVTDTDPDNADTGNTGTLDSYKDMALDGWSNLEKFRCRSNPLKTAYPPATVELSHPTGLEISKAVSQQSDLPFELHLEVRTNSATTYQDIETQPTAFYSAMNYRQANEQKNFDLRISWRVPQRKSYEPGDPNYTETPRPEQTIESLEGKANLKLFEDFTNSLANKPPFTPNDKSNMMVAIEHAYRQGEIDKGVAMVEMILLKNYEPQDFYGKVIDQDGNPLPGASLSGELVLNDGSYGGTQVKKLNTVTDGNGLFEFTGIHGAGFGVTINKSGYDNEWRNDPYKSPSGGRSNPTNRAIYRMWSTNIHEQLITGNKSFEILPDGKPHFINLTDGTISEQEGGDLKVWIQYTNQAVQGQLYDWSAGIEVINGGLWEVPQAAMNSGFMDGFHIPMFTAPADGYVPSFTHKGQIKGGQSGEIGNRYFYLLLNGGKEYGKMGINLFAPYGYLHPGLIRLSYTINPSGSRVLR